MHVKIIEPSYYLPDGTLCRYPKLWLTGLTAIHLAALTPDEYKVSICNEVLNDVDLDDDVDLVALTAMGKQLFRAIDLADAFRERGKKVVIGGYQSSLSPEIVEPHVDALVFSDAEPIWHQILDDARAGCLQKRYVGIGDAPLTGLPVPRYDLLDRKRHSRLFPVEATRGCPKVCGYCTVTQRYHKSFRTYPIDDVLRNVEAVLSLGIRNIFFVDNNLIGDFEYAKKLFDALRSLNIRWAGQTTVEIADDPELLDLAKESGCISLSIGFESINQRSLRSVSKGFNKTKSYQHIIREIRKRKIHVIANIMFGFDDDLEDVFLKTADFFDKSGVSVLDCFILVPMPGTTVFDRLKQEGRLLTEDYRYYNVTNVVFQPKQMTAKKLHEGLWIALRRFYRYSSIVRRMARSPMGKPYIWGAALGLNYLFRRMVYNHNKTILSNWPTFSGELELSLPLDDKQKERGNS